MLKQPSIEGWENRYDLSIAMMLGICSIDFVMQETLIIVAAITSFVLLVLILIYNSFVNRRNQVRYAFSCIDVQLKKRYDLIPNLVETVKGFAGHERETLEAVTHARQQAGQRGSCWHDQEMLTQATHSVIALAESYPALQSDRNFQQLQRNLTECEEQIAAARRAYNASVMDYHNAIGMFPGSLVASLFRFTPMASFEAAIEERGNVDVRF